ncbi:MAG: hypothetical protein PUC18_00305 [Prevotellaceae bacterium]|nr:hypothetical protein [Prevotellaceae bacterium]
MEIKAIRMFDGGFMNQPFAFGGEEVILVDTGFQNDYPAPVKKLGAPLYMGEKVADYMDSLAPASL